MHIIDLTTNLLDLTSFFLATPELIGIERVEKFSESMTRLFNWTPNSRWGWVSRISEYQMSFLLTGSGMIVSASLFVSVMVAIILIVFVIQPNWLNYQTTFLMKFWAVGVGVPLTVVWFFRLWIFLARTRDLKRVLLLLAGVTFIISRAIALLGACDLF